MEDNSTISRLSDEILLYITKAYNPLTFTYEAEVTCFSKVLLKMSISNSKNFAFEQSSCSTERSVTLSPGRRTTVGSVSMVDASFRGELKVEFSWEILPMDAEALRELCKHQEHKVMENIRANEELNARFGKPTTLSEVAQQYLSSQIQFVDLDFPPNSSSIRSHVSPVPFQFKSHSNRTVSNADSFSKQAVCWRRPREFMTSSKTTVQVFKDGISPQDIRQGSIANCWLMCALASLAEYPSLIESLIPASNSSTASLVGAYEVRLCKDGMWQNVLVDDFFPCFPGGGPVYSRAHGEELWVLLIEKAYAKLCGSYESIRYGWAYEALIDLTGQPSLNLRLDDSDVLEDVESGALWSQLTRFDLLGCLMCASTPGEDMYSEGAVKLKQGTSSGLVSGHAYSLISCKVTSQGTKLVQLRNPWGCFEWTGDWSDGSELWTPEIQAEVGADLQTDDGTFWMSFEDLVQYFFSINICLSKSPTSRRNWIELRKRIMFVGSSRDADSVSIHVPMFLLTVSQQTEVSLSVHQRDMRARNAESYIDIGVSVLQILAGSDEVKLVLSTGTSSERQVQTPLASLQPGRYLVVPTTTGGRLSSLSKHLAAASEPLVLVDDATQELHLTDRLDAIIDEVFDRFDSTGSNFLDHASMSAFCQVTEGCELEMKTFQWMMRQFDSCERGISRQGFKDMQMFLIEELIVQCQNESEGRGEQPISDPNLCLDLFRRELASLGYHPATLRLVCARQAVLAVHSDHAVTLDAVPFDADLFEEAVELPVIEHGRVTELDGGSIQLFTRKSNYCGISFVVRNCSTSPLHFRLDCSESKNATSHTGSLVSELCVPPAEAKVLLHLMPREPREDWCWAYNASYRWS